jgi:hypothetical protein
MTKKVFLFSLLLFFSGNMGGYAQSEVFRSIVKERGGTTQDVQWSSDKDCEVFDIRNCYLIFERCKYQYYTDRGKIVKHGDIECTNGVYRFVWNSEWNNNKVNVKGHYHNGKKDGQWHYTEEYVIDGKSYIKEVVANYSVDKLDGEYGYSKKENGKVIERVICGFVKGKPFGKYYQMRGNTETTIHYDYYGTKTGPMTIITENEEHHGTFKHDFLHDYYYLDKKTKEKFTPAEMQGKIKSIKLLQFTDDSDDNAGIVLCRIIGTDTIID